MKYKVRLLTTLPIYEIWEVDADSKEEAGEKAEEGQGKLLEEQRDDEHQVEVIAAEPIYDEPFWDYGKETFTISEKVRVQWTNLGEGRSGDYNEDDPDDVNLLRFDVLTWNATTIEWDAVDNGSYCTRMPVDTDGELLGDVARRIAEDVQDDLPDGSYKKKLERWSWVSPEEPYKLEE